ncbi:MAG: alpha/beta fold hydrolase, partial [Chloroflexi bacterium]|nr:alpha/beta fold hydrolase [Chloroflexota bacterium]
MTPRRWLCVMVGGLLGMAVLLAGCDAATGDEATPTVSPVAVRVWPSATVLPLLPTRDSFGAPAIGFSNPTQARMAAEGQPDEAPPTRTPEPTAVSLGLRLPVGSGIDLQATYYTAPLRPTPGVLLVHMAGRDRTSWEPLANRLQAEGYIVLTVDLRGHGESEGSVDWAQTQDDLRAVLDEFAGYSGVDASQLIVIGAGEGANLALNVCVDRAGCAAAVLLSPQVDYHGITTPGAMARRGDRPVLILASENDGRNPADSQTLDNAAIGDHRLIIYPTGHGTDILTAHPDAVATITVWVRERVPPPTT